MIKTNNQTAVKTQRKFDRTFKREAVNNWLTSGKSASVVALELGILPNRLYAWRKAVAPAAGPLAPCPLRRARACHQHLTNTNPCNPLPAI